MAQRRGLFGGFNPVRFSGEPNERMMMIGSVLQSLGKGGDPAPMQAVAAARQGRIAQDRYRSDISPHDSPNGSGTGTPRSREEMLAALMQASANGLDVSRDARLYESMNPDPQYFNTSQGIYGVQGGKASPVLQIAPKPDLPPGWRVTADGQWEPIPGGPADPTYVRRLSDERREAISTRPMPRAGRASSGGSSGRPTAQPAAPRSFSASTIKWD